MDPDGRVLPLAMRTIVAMTVRERKTFHIRTYGCQMNELDTELMAGQLTKRGFTQVASEEEADLLIFNTCSIRDLAERKVMGKIGLLGRVRKRKLIGVTGCMAMAKKEALFRKLPQVDFVIGTNNITDLGDVVEEVIETGERRIRVSDRFEENLDYLAAKRDNPLKAYVSIIRGCDKFCTYCVVPYTRGREVSRPAEDIENECRVLAGKGYKEVTLLGQNVNSYGKDKGGKGELFHDLLYRLDKIEGLERIRFMTSHPVDITLSLMEAIRDLPSLCEFVHFPMQAGSDRILRKMHRIYTKREYFTKVALLKETIPNASLGTDMIVGFPTETDADFEETYEAFKAIRYSVAFLYTFSPRKGTPAMRWRDDVSAEVKEERLKRLMTLYEEVAAEERAGMMGDRVEVLVDRKTRDGRLRGRTGCWKKILFPGDASMIGTLQSVRVLGFTHHTLIGEVIVANPR
ncbi:MAG: tRNA (N6-isopentenyl adenosine(37)-C2)-methylthiotransferase MiaB [Simkaniaceae bacterium]|nr:tRNA (N6-isopentenyl adenosine(37)-C2)-methylthiotransferase MiaB [Simkaniaceae bacterium]